MPAIADTDLTRMRSALLFDGTESAQRLSRFWVLLVLAAVIASCGIIADSTATVIGAMIVAPLMTPILGTVLSVVSGDLRNLVRSVVLVVAGAAAVVAVAWIVGQLTPISIDADTSSQVAGRIHPRLIDLIAALATGAVGSFALVRSDVSDTLPGVAIAISLVPPLAVVGLTLESGSPHQSVGALLLFLTNVVAILLSGLIVMSIYHVRAEAAHLPSRHHLGTRAATLLVVVAVVALAIPLAAASGRITQEELRKADVSTVAKAWASDHGWEIVDVDPSSGIVLVRAAGPLPGPEPGSLRAALDAGGLGAVDVRLELSPVNRFDLPGG